MLRLHSGRSCRLNCPRHQQIGGTLLKRPRTAVSASKGGARGGSRGRDKAAGERQDASGRQVPRQQQGKNVSRPPAQTSKSASPRPQQGSDSASTSDPWRQPATSTASRSDKPATGPRLQQRESQSQHKPDDPAVAQSQQADTDLSNDPWRQPAAAAAADPQSTPIKPRTGPPQQQRQDQEQQRQGKQQQQGARARLSWRSRTGTAAAAAKTGQGAAPRLSWRSSSSSSSQPTDTTASSSSQASTDPEDDDSPQSAAAFSADTDDYESPPTSLYAAANLAPGFFREQVDIATDDEINIFMVQGMNNRYATPESREQIGKDTDDMTSAYTAGITEAKQQLPQENQQALSRIAAAAAAALAAARSRPGGLSPDDLSVAETAADVAALTQSPFTAKIALEVVHDVSEGRQPDPQSLELVMDPSTISIEAFGAHGPTFDEAILRTAEGLPPFDDPWSMSGEVVLEYLEQCRSWESAARVYMAARPTPAMSTPQLLCLCEVLPGLVNPQELGFRAQLRWNTLVEDIMKDLLMRPETSAQLTPTNIHTIIVALGRMHLPSGPLQLQSPSQNDETSEALLSLITTHLPGFSVRQLGDVLCGLGKAEVTVTQQWAGNMWKGVANRARNTPLDTLSLSKALYGCALLQYKPQRSTLKAFYDRSKQHMDEFKPLQITNLLWAVASLDLQPPPSWLITVLGVLINGQTWSTDGQTICHGMDHGVETFDRQELAAAANDLKARGAAAAAAADDQDSSTLLPAAAAVPAGIAAAAARADPYIHQPVKEGPLPFARQSTDYYWTQLLDGNDSSSSSSVGLLSADLPPMLPVAPPTLLTLNPKQLLQLVESLSDLQLCSEDERVADLLDEIWAAAVHSSSSSSSGGRSGSDQDPAAAAAASGEIPVSQLRTKQQGRVSQQQQQRSAGFGTPKQSRKGKAKKQQQQQQRQSASASSSSSSNWVDSQLVAQFDTASGGLWTAAMQGNWSLRQLATAAAMIDSSSSSNNDTAAGSGSSSVSDPSNTTDHSHNHKKDPDLDQYFDTLDTLDLEDLDLGDLDLADIAAAAAAASSTVSAAAATLTDASAAVSSFMNAWYAASKALLPHTEPAAAVSMIRAVALCTSPWQSPFAPGALPQNWQQQQQQKVGTQPPSQADVGSAPSSSVQQQQQVPPLPAPGWIAAAVRRLVITRSALSEVALLHALEALDKILQEHPQREQLLLPPQQQQQQQQQQGLWWWQQQQQDWLQHNAESTSAAAAASAGGSSAFKAGSSSGDLNQAPNAAAAGARPPPIIYDSSWIFAQSLTGTPNTTSSSSSQPISSSSSSVFTGLQKLVKCVQHNLGSLLNLAAVVQLLAHIVRLSPQLVDKSWLQNHEGKILQMLQEEGWMPSSSSSSRSGLESSCLSAVEAGLTPEMCGVLVTCYNECSYDMKHRELKEVCEVLAGVDDN